MKLLLRYLQGYTGMLILALALAAVNQIFSLLDPFIFQHIIDRYVSRYNEMSQSAFFRGSGLLLLAAVTVALISRLAKNFQDYYVNVITQRLGAKLYADGITHSLELPYSLFEDQRSGETLGKLQKVRTDVEKLITAVINILFPAFVGIVFILIYAFTVHWVIAPVLFTSVPVLGVVVSILSRHIKRLQQIIVTETTALAGSTTESLRNIELVKSLGLAHQEIDRLNATTDKILELELRKVRYVRSLSFIQGTCVNLLRTAILFLMLYLIFHQQVTVGQFFTLFIYSFYIFGPLQELGNIINIYRETEASLGEFQKILALDREPVPSNPVALEKIRRIDFDQVCFRHRTATHNALTDIAFSGGVGETLAFVGPSGSGKTTLVKLLLGLYRPHTGEVRFNSTPLEAVDLGDFRNQFGLVTQDTQLFSGTIRENLLFAKPDADDARCRQVLEQAACDSLMERVQDGLESVIGEGGIKVSGGERQRLSIARALLREPAVLVFDEATSALDSLTENEINTTIRDVSAGNDRITILIAHRLSTVMHADRIYVLEKGHIVESGKHDDLVAEKGLYYAMWRQQIGERHVPECG